MILNTQTYYSFVLFNIGRLYNFFLFFFQGSDKKILDTTAKVWEQTSVVLFVFLKCDV